MSASSLDLSHALDLPPPRRRSASLPIAGGNDIVGPLAESMRVRQRDRWAAERSIAVAQLGSASFSDQRIADLTSSGAPYLARIYGMRTANRLLATDQQAGLLIPNNNSSPYQRSSQSGEFADACRRIVERRYPNLVTAPLVFLHSKRGVDRLKKRLKREGGGKADALKESYELLLGLVAVRCDDPTEMQKMVTQIGATPSSYEVFKFAFNDSALNIPANPNADNDALLGTVIGACDGAAKPVFDNLPSSHPMKAVAGSAMSLVQGLQETFAPEAGQPEFTRNEVIARALQVLQDIVLASRTMTEDSGRFFSAYQAMMDEIFVMLAVVRPYRSEHFKQAGSAALTARSGGLIDDMQGKGEIAAPQPYLVSSGMEAITVGLEAAETLSGGNVRFLSDKPRDRLPDYFEVPGLFVEAESKDMQIAVAVLNPSTPRARSDSGDAEIWNAKTLTERLKQQLQKTSTDGGTLTLVLDVSVETPEDDGASDLRYLLSECREDIARGALKIVLCKSYQKYPSLSSGKIMAGSVTVVAKDDVGTQAANTYLAENETDIRWMQNDDAQLLTHFLKYGHNSELDLLARAAGNAAFIDSCFALGDDQTGFDRYQEGLPFGLIEHADTPLESSGVSKTLKDLIAAAAETRNSFGFLNTTSGVFPLNDVQVARVAAGQESREELVEKFYGLGRIVHQVRGYPIRSEDDEGVPVDPDALVAEANRIAAAAAQIVMRDAEPEEWADAAFRIVRAREASASRTAGAGATKGSSFLSSVMTLCNRILFSCVGRRDPAAGLLPGNEAEEGPDDPEALLDSVLKALRLPAGADVATNELPQLRAALRNALVTGLQQTADASENLLADNLIIVGRAFAPRTTTLLDHDDRIDGSEDGRPVSTESDRDSAGSGGTTSAGVDVGRGDASGGYIDRLRSSMSRDPDGLREPEAGATNADRYFQARYASNMVASMFDVAGAFVPRGSGDHEAQKKLADDYAMLLKSGLNGISSGMRNKLVSTWFSLQGAKLEGHLSLDRNEDDAEAASAVAAQPIDEPSRRLQNGVVDEMIANSRLVVHADERARLLLAIPNPIFNNLTKSNRKKLAEAMFSGLDLASRPALIETMISATSTGKADACLEIAVDQLRRASTVSRLQPEQLGDVSTPNQTTMNPGALQAARVNLLCSLFPKHPGEHARPALRTVAKWSKALCHDDNSIQTINGLATAIDAYLVADAGRVGTGVQMRRTQVLQMAAALQPPYDAVRPRITTLVS